MADISISDLLVNSGAKYRKEALQMPLAQIEDTLKHMRLVRELRGEEVEPTILPVGNFVPVDENGTPTGTSQIKARKLTTYQLMLWQRFNPNSLYGSVFDSPLKEDMVNNDTVRTLVVEAMRNGSNGLNSVIWTGVRNASGTTQAANFDGFDTIVKAEKTAGNIALSKGNFLQLGKVNEYNIGDKLRLMWVKANADLKGDSSKQLKLFMPLSAAEMYDKWFITNYGQANFAGGQFNQRFLHGTNGKVEIVALPGMEGAEHFILTTADNMKVGFDNSGSFNQFRIEHIDNPMVLQLFAQIFMGVQFASVDPHFAMFASAQVTTGETYLTTDVDEVVFDDTVSGSSDTFDITLFGINMTAATAITIDGTNAAMFSTGAASVSAADANAAAGKEVTLTFSPTATGDKTANLHIKNTTDDVDITIVLKGKGTAS